MFLHTCLWILCSLGTHFLMIASKSSSASLQWISNGFCIATAKRSWCSNTFTEKRMNKAWTTKISIILQYYQCISHNIQPWFQNKTGHCVKLYSHIILSFIWNKLGCKQQKSGSAGEPSKNNSADDSAGKQVHWWQVMLSWLRPSPQRDN